MSPQKSFAPWTVERSGPPASPRLGSTSDIIHILEGLRKNLSMQATEGRYYSMGQGAPFPSSPFSVTESATSPECRRRHHRTNAEHRVPIIVPLDLPNNMSGSALVDVHVFHDFKYDTSPARNGVFTEKRTSLMVIDHEKYDVCNVPRHLALNPESSDTATFHHYNQTLNTRSVPPDYHANDHNALVLTTPPRPATPPLSPPAESDSLIVSKRSGGIFGLVPFQKDRFVHVVATDMPGGQIERTLDSPHSPSPTRYGFPPEMLATLDELDELANRIRDLPYPERASGGTGALIAPVSSPHALETLWNDFSNHFLQRPASSDKGKGQEMSESIDDMGSLASKRMSLFSTSPSANISTSTPVRQSTRYIYDPRSAPLFLVGSSTSLVAYHAEGYHSPPLQSGFRSVSNVLPSFPVSPPSGVTSFKAMFKRSRLNTMSAPETNIFGKDKKMFWWIKI